MKHIQLFTIAALVIVSWGTSLYAQDDQSLPQGTLLKSAPGFSKWKIQFSYGSDANAGVTSATPTPTLDLAAELPPHVVEVTFTIPFWHASVTDMVNRKTEVWFDGTTPYVILPNAPEPNPVAADDVEKLSNYLNFTHKNPSFPDMEWISLKTFTGRETINGTPCLVFKKPGDADITVWISEGPRLPVRWTKGTETRDFVFEERPSSRLILPPKIQAKIKAMAVVNFNNGLQPPRGG